MGYKFYQGDMSILVQWSGRKAKRQQVVDYLMQVVGYSRQDAMNVVWQCSALSKEKAEQLAEWKVEQKV